MTGAADQDAAALANVLHRLDALTARLDQVADSGAREAARELLELMLDLHGLALARTVSIVAATGNGRALVDALAADPHVRAIMLLHGLHPQDAKTRLDLAIATKQAEWAGRGFRVDLLCVDDNTAHVRLHRYGGSESLEDLRRDVEAMLTEAAPDLDDIALETEVAGAANAAAGICAIPATAAAPAG